MWIIKRKPHQSHWSIIKSVPKKRRRVPNGIGAVIQTRHSRQGVSKKITPVPAPLQNNVRRIPAPDEPLAFCARCNQWTPMRWLPKEERSRAAETWFECEYCGCRELKLRYVVRAI
jgi:hypothetical protein